MAATDISPTALAIGATAQLPGDDITWVATDLTVRQLATTYDLVTSSFLSSEVDLPRESIFRRAATSVAPAGMLLIVGHSGAPHWLSADAADHGHADDYPHTQENQAEHKHDDADLPTALSQSQI